MGAGGMIFVDPLFQRVLVQVRESKNSGATVSYDARFRLTRGSFVR